MLSECVEDRKMCIWTLPCGHRLTQQANRGELCVCCLRPGGRRQSEGVTFRIRALFEVQTGIYLKSSRERTSHLILDPGQTEYWVQLLHTSHYSYFTSRVIQVIELLSNVRYSQDDVSHCTFLKRRLTFLICIFRV